MLCILQTQLLYLLALLSVVNIEMLTIRIGISSCMADKIKVKIIVCDRVRAQFTALVSVATAEVMNIIENVTIISVTRP